MYKSSWASVMHDQSKYSSENGNAVRSFFGFARLQSSEGRTVLVHARQGVPEKYIRLVKGMSHQCETLVSCAAGTS